MPPPFGLPNGLDAGIRRDGRDWSNYMVKTDLDRVSFLVGVASRPAGRGQRGPLNAGEAWIKLDASR